MNHANAESYSPYCAKTHTVWLIETTDGVFGLHYRGNRIGTVLATVVRRNVEGTHNQMLKELIIIKYG
jgi:hypothetical protein